MNLREKNKEVRRQRILDAAEALIVKRSSTDFTMQQLAEEAGLSKHTPYNLIGSKSTVLFSLLNRLLDRLDPAFDGTSDPLGHLFHSGEVACEVFIENKILYKPLMRFLFGIPDENNRPKYMRRAYKYWCNASTPLYQSGMLEDEIDSTQLSIQINISIVGILELWIHEELDDAQLKVFILKSIYIISKSSLRVKYKKRVDSFFQEDNLLSPKHFPT